MYARHEARGDEVMPIRIFAAAMAPRWAFRERPAPGIAPPLAPGRQRKRRGRRSAKRKARFLPILSPETWASAGTLTGDSFRQSVPRWWRLLRGPPRFCPIPSEWAGTVRLASRLHSARRGGGRDLAAGSALAWIPWKRGPCGASVPTVQPVSIRKIGRVGAGA